MQGDLTTLSAVKSWLNIASTSDDVLLSRLITSTSQYIQSWLNRSFALQSYTERRSGTGTYAIALSNYPAAVINSVLVGAFSIPASTDGVSAGYVTDGKFIYLVGYLFTQGIMNVTLTYTAGYATTPPEIEQCCIELLSIRYKERQRIGENSKSIGGETISFDVKDMPASVKTILNNYRKVLPL
jgi:hypothetical protein